MELVRAYLAEDELMANSICDLLLQNGIQAVIQRTTPSSIYGTTGGMFRSAMRASTPFSDDFGTWGAVFVHAQDLEAALEQIGGFLGKLGMLEEAEP